VTPSHEPIRIFWQGFLDLEGAHRSYGDKLRQHVEAAADPGTTVQMVGLDPPVSHIDRITELRCGVAALHNAIAADTGDHDALVIGHFQEPLLEEIRASVDMPVVALGEAALLHACTIGRRIGLVTIDTRFIPWHEEQVARHGLERRVVGVTALEISPSEFMSRMGPDSDDDFVTRFAQAAQPLLDAGADVLVPAGALPSLALATRQRAEIGQAPVLDIVRVALKHAECAVKLQRSTGLGTSRRGALAKPPAAALEALRRHTGGG
jgi:allantoin racemase